jgi:hypothetical protein
MNEVAGTNTPRGELLSAVAAAFPGRDPAPILAQLDRYGTKPWERERERVQLAIVTLSQGDAAKLADLVDVARRDYRDVLAWVAMPPLSKEEGEREQRRLGELLERWSTSLEP